MAGESGICKLTRLPERFARRTLIPLLAMGDTLTPDERQTAYQQLAGLIGLPQ